MHENPLAFYLLILSCPRISQERTEWNRLTSQKLQQDLIFSKEGHQVSVCASTHCPEVLKAGELEVNPGLQQKNWRNVPSDLNRN